MDKRSKAMKGLKCCVEFLCGECPYAEYQHIEYKLQCIHKMHKDLFEVLFVYKGGLNNDIIDNDIFTYS